MSKTSEMNDLILSIPFNDKMQPREKMLLYLTLKCFESENYVLKYEKWNDLYDCLKIESSSGHEALSVISQNDLFEVNFEKKYVRFRTSDYYDEHGKPKFAIG
jgi:hypothetical protein